MTRAELLRAIVCAPLLVAFTIAYFRYGPLIIVADMDGVAAIVHHIAGGF